MIDYTSIRRDIENYIDGNYDETLVVFENKSPDLEDVKELIALNDTIIDSDRPMISNPAQLMYGYLTVEIYTQLGIGTNRSREIASMLSTIILAKTSGPVEFSDTELHSVPTTKDSIYFQQNLHIPYTLVYGDVSISC